MHKFTLVKKVKKIKKMTKSVDPVMFIDLSLLVNYFGDSSDSDYSIPSIVEKDDSDIDMVIESTKEGMLFSCSTFQF